MKNKKVLIIAPHMDDEVLGCAGTILKHKSHGDKVSVVFIAHRIYSHRFNKEKNDIEKNHALRAQLILGYDRSIFLGLPDERLDASVQDVIVPLENTVDKLKPDIVYLPFRGDNHQDHRAVFDAARVVLRPSAVSPVKTIYMYEVPSSTEQSPPMPENAFLPNYYIDITGFLDKKLEAILCYETEKRPWPHPRSKEAIKILAKKRGTEIGFKCAEAFMILREQWR